jgi:hypothetical protein
MSFPTRVNRPLAAVSEDGHFMPTRKLVGQNLRVQAMPSMIVQVVNH